MANNKKEERSFKEIVLGFIPAVLLSIVIFPILGYFSYSIYSSSIIGASKSFEVVMLLLIIGLNLLVLSIVFYVANMFFKTNIKRHALVGCFIILILLILTIVRYTAYKEIDIKTNSEEYFKLLNDFKFTRAILIGYVTYYFLAMLLNRISVVSLKNKKR